jgi:hypothetical protein
MLAAPPLAAPPLAGTTLAGTTLAVLAAAVLVVTRLAGRPPVLAVLPLAARGLRVSG